MIRYRLVLFSTLIALLVALWSAVGGAAQAGTGVVKVAPVDDENFPKMRALVTVVDSNGIPMTGLTAAQFSAFEESKNVSLTVSERVNPQTPVAVLLVLDKSGSMTAKSAVNADKTKLDDAKDAAVRFLQRLGPDDRAAVIAFGGSVDLNTGLDDDCNAPGMTLEHTFTTDKGALINCVNGITSQANVVTTPLYDAAYKAVVAAEQEARAQDNTPVVVLFTDGREGDRAGKPVSVSPRVAAELAARQSRIAIFTVGVGSDADIPYIRALAAATGGEFGDAVDPSRLDEYYAVVVDRLRTQYELRWVSLLEADGGQHQLDLKVSVKGKELANQASFSARKPVRPGIRFVYNKPTGIFGMGKEYETLSVTPGQDFPSTWSLVPNIHARNDIVRVEYYLNDEQTPAFVAEGKPFVLPWSSTQRQVNEPTEFRVRAVAVDAAGNRGEESVALRIVPGGIDVGWVAALVGLVLVVAVIALVFALRRQQVQDQAVVVDAPVPAPLPVQPGQHTPSESAASLSVVSGPDFGRRFPLVVPETRVGRNPENNIILSDPTVGRDHLSIQYDNGRFMARDLGSLNKLRVNGSPVQVAMLADNDRLELGNTALVFHLN